MRIWVKGRFFCAYTRNYTAIWCLRRQQHGSSEVLSENQLRRIVVYNFSILMFGNFNNIYDFYNIRLSLFLLFFEDFFERLLNMSCKFFQVNHIYCLVLKTKLKDKLWGFKNHMNLKPHILDISLVRFKLFTLVL